MLKEEGEEKAAAGLLFAGGSRFLQVQNFTLSAERPGRDQRAGRSGCVASSRRAVLGEAEGIRLDRRALGMAPEAGHQC